MNKYQRAILENQDVKVFYTCSSVKNSAVLVAAFDYDTDTYALTQEEDIFSTAYEFVIKANLNIASCEYYCNGAWNAAEKKAGNFVIILDFEKRAEKVKFTFADNLADDYIFTVNYTEADKDLYYQKQAETRRNTYIEAAQIKHSTGADLVNIYFQPCCANCEKTEVELYIAKGKYASPGRGTYVACAMPLIGGEVQQLIGKFTIDGGFLFKSISGLANGVYAYRLRQFSKNDEMLFESDFQFFEIRPQGAGRPMGRINRI